MKKNLVIAAVGDESVHPTWLAGADRSFDLALVYFGDRPRQFERDAEYYVQRKGIKYALLHELLTGELAESVSRYERVWLPDDDVAASTKQINLLFDLAAKYKLALSQPAIGRGDVSFKTLRAQPGYLLRYSRFVEMMCPLFSREALERLTPTFIANKSGWGIDWLWASMYDEHQIAVIDAVAVDHTRPLQSGGVHRRLTAMGVDPHQEQRDLLRRHGILNRRFQRATCRGTTRLRGIRLDGQQVWTRSWLAAALKLRAA